MGHVFSLNNSILNSVYPCRQPIQSTLPPRNSRLLLPVNDMPKKSKVSSNTSQSSKSASAVSSDLTFPDISQKEGLECRVLLEDQIILIDVRYIQVPAIR